MPEPPPVAIIFAAGEGKRLKPHTDIVPKPLLPITVDGVTILDVIMTNIAASGTRRFVLVVGYMHNMIEKRYGDGSRFGIDVEYVLQQHPNDPWGAFSDFAQATDLHGPALVANGDVITDVDPRAMVTHDQGVVATILAVRSRIPYGVMEVGVDLRVLRFVEKPVLDAWVNGGMYYFRDVSEVLGGSMLEFDVLPLLAGRGVLRAVPHMGYWRSIDSYKDYDEVREDGLDPAPSKLVARAREMFLR
jgi:NDP-sugar pyrophosphorylase family protein